MGLKEKYRELYNQFEKGDKDQLEYLVHSFCDLDDNCALYVAKYIGIKINSKPCLDEHALCVHYMYRNPDHFDFHEYREKCIDMMYGLEDINVFLPKVLPLN